MDLSKEAEVLSEQVNQYVQSALDKHPHYKIQSSKVIHDAILGTNRFTPYEVAFIDLPIVQRLRRVSQIDVAPLAFPSGNHNRFEHTIGVTAMVGNMIDALFQNEDDALKDTKISYEYARIHCRIAAILHDCGHGPFSHLSEQVYKPLLKEIKEENSVFSGASAHEMLSYFIATSPALKRFNEHIIKEEYGIEVDLDFVGEIIVGHISDKKKAFLVELINGAFDADKLDYILRDSHATGLHMALDMSRLLYTIRVLEDDTKTFRLSVDISGAVTLEQIVFNKMYLANSIYHHQKVLAAGCLMKSVIGEYNKLGKLLTPSDYLYYADDRLCCPSEECMMSDQMMNYLTRIAYRNLPHRALIISARTIEKNKHKLWKIMQLEEKPDEIEKITNEIIDFVNSQGKISIKRSQIWLCIPKAPAFKEGLTCKIRALGEVNNSITLRELFPIDDWVKAFSQNKWRAYVFADQEIVNEVADASQYVFEYLYEIKFNKFSKVMCKISDEVDII